MNSTSVKQEYEYTNEQAFTAWLWSEKYRHDWVHRRTHLGAQKSGFREFDCEYKSLS